MPSDFALSSLVPGFSPAMTRSVFFETDPVTLAPSDSSLCASSSRLNRLSVPVRTIVFPAKGDDAGAAGERGSRLARSTPADSENDAVAGLQVRSLNTEEMRAAKLSSGVMVSFVAQGSVAEEAGIEAGDVIEEVGGKPVSSVSEFTKALAEAKKARKHAVLLVNAGASGNTRFVALRLE